MPKSDNHKGFHQAKNPDACHQWWVFCDEDLFRVRVCVQQFSSLLLWSVQNNQIITRKSIDKTPILFRFIFFKKHHTKVVRLHKVVKIILIQKLYIKFVEFLISKILICKWTKKRKKAKEKSKNKSKNK